MEETDLHRKSEWVLEVLVEAAGQRAHVKSLLEAWALVSLVEVAEQRWHLRVRHPRVQTSQGMRH